jgi:hypothetical protein
MQDSWHAAYLMYYIILSYPRTGINLSQNIMGIRPVLHLNPKRLHMISRKLGKLCVPVTCIVQYEQKKIKGSVRSQAL